MPRAIQEVLSGPFNPNQDVTNRHCDLWETAKWVGRQIGPVGAGLASIKAEIKAENALVEGDQSQAKEWIAVRDGFQQSVVSGSEG